MFIPIQLSRQPSACLDYLANVGALILRIGLLGILYYKYDKEPPKIS